MSSDPKMNYNFIYDEALVKKTEEIFIKPYHKYVFNYHMTYRSNKILELKDQPTERSWTTRILYPSSFREGVFTYKENCLTDNINKNFNNNYTFSKGLSFDGMALYLGINPKEVDRAVQTLNQNINNELWNLYNSDKLSKDSLNRIFYYPIEKQLATILDKQTKFRWFHFETDTKNQVFQYLDIILDKYNLSDKIFIIETHGGYHFIISNQFVQNKNYPNLIIDLFTGCPRIDDNRYMFTKLQGRIPIPGTIQYGFPVQFLKLADPTL
jgi:hypothetical protein